MKKTLCLAGLCGVLAAGAAAQDLTAVATGAQIISGAGVTQSTPRFLAASGATTLIMANQTASSNADFRIVSIDISGVSPAFTVLATKTDLDNAVTAASGTPLASVTVRGMAVAANGNVILATDDAGGSFLFRITGANTVQLLSGLQATNSVDGVNRLGMLGNTAFAFINDAFAVSPNNNTDHIQTFDVTATADGLQAGTELTNEAALLGAISGSSQATVVLNAPTPLSATTLFFANSGGSGATDELLTVTSTGTVSLAKSRASILSDLSDTDVGWGAAAYHAASDTVFLTNSFGAAADDDVIAVTNGGTGTASVFVTDATLEADADYTGAGISWQGDGLVCIGDDLYFSDGLSGGGVYKIALPVGSAVTNWSLYD